MANIKLTSILSDLLKEMVNQHPEHKKINDKLTQIAKRDLEDNEDEIVSYIWLDDPNGSDIPMKTRVYKNTKTGELYTRVPGDGMDDKDFQNEEVVKDKDYVVTYWVINNDDKDDYDETVKASSTEEAIEKVKKGAPRLARNFTAKLK